MHQTYLDELRAVLARVRRRWLAARSMRATARVAFAIIGLLLLLLFTDRFLRPADLPMVGLFLVALVLGATVFLRAFWPLRRSPSDRQVARFIEERCPALEDRLASATDLTRNGRRSVFFDLVVGDAANRTRDLDLDLVVSRGDVGRSIATGLGGTVVLVVILILGSGSLGRVARTAWLYAFPATAALRVEPGDARVVAGQSVRLRATLEASVGVVPRSAPVVSMTAASGDERTMPMNAVDGAYVLDLATVDDSFVYRVRAASVVSDEYEITVLFPPQIHQIDVAYQYPAATGLPGRVDTDGGDIYAPVGTEVTISVHMTKVVEQGELELGGGRRVTLRSTGEATLQGSFEVLSDDTYQVRAIDRDGLVNADDLDYFIRTVRDRPPTVEIVRPLGDRDITLLEEIVIEARAEDDYGLERFELVYAVAGRPERVVDLGLAGETPVANASGTHTIFAEELELQPGDFISYYARARDTSTGQDVTDKRSDIYFLEVRPFSLEFEEAQSQGGGGMQVGDLGRLAHLQKQIVVATWKLDGQPGAERAPADIETVADAQSEVRLTAELLTARMRAPTPQVGLDGRAGATDGGDALGLAVGAMAEAEAALRAERTSAAIPPEMTALNQLLKAQTEAGRTQVTQSGSQGGRGSGPGAQENLTALFDEDLRRDQETNYEHRASAAQTAEEQGDSEIESRLKELADRQEALTERQRDTASREQELDVREVRRRLERLTREQEDLRRQMEDLTRELARRERKGRGDQTDAQATRQAGEHMQRALSELRRGDLSQAADRAQAALDSLRDLERDIGRGSEVRRGQALGEMRLEAEQIAEAQGWIADEASRLGVTGDGSTRQRLAEQEAGLAERVDALGDRLEQARPFVSEDDVEPVERASKVLREGDVAQQMRDLAETLQRVAESTPTDLQEARSRTGQDVEAIMESPVRLADVIKRVAAELAELGSRQEGAADQLSKALEDAQDLGQRLERIEQQLGNMTGRTAESAGDSSTESDGDQLAALQAELGRRLREFPELFEQLRRARPALEQDLERWGQQRRSGVAPGTEAFKQDRSVWANLYSELRVALEEFEASRSRELAEEVLGGRHHVGPTQAAPERYRHLVDEYYRSLASGRDAR